ncbi:hypothetical protein LM602_02865 [Candidatus Acetothermia bacterium]|jgi:hypothetical protein|nr:hypothetical protein [Candidatus Acetothermia bacterium]MCI2431485.1 hypothetical protein [Candidatus Acetothermia bacterium]MCI2436447.1 hypothetical protein [Candidatus Acetothermia bacterium]
MQTLVQFLPLTPLMQALRAVALNDASLISLGPELLQVGLWLAATFLLAAKVFKFRTD